MDLAEIADFIAPWEGLAQLRADGLVYPYRDIAGVETVGYGITDPAIVGGAPYTPQQCRRHLVIHLQALIGQVVTVSPVLVDPKNADRLTAIASFAFNLGIGAYRGSTLRRRVDAQDWAGAAAQIRRWVFAGGRRVNGLVRRRASEAALLLAG